MRYNTFVSSSADLQGCKEAGLVDEVLIETVLLAREGRLDLNQARSLGSQALEMGLRPVLVWDILMTDQEFGRSIECLQQVGLNNFSAIRVQCIGAAQYLRRNHPTKKVQLIAETANCNLPTLALWCERLGEILERIILSIQLPSEKIQEYVRALPVPCEVLGAGRILLFYSRRNLLLKDFSDLGEEWREVLAESEDSGGRPYPVIDNTHGTFMYLDKDQFILHKLDDLNGHVPAYLRIDLRHISEFPHSAFGIKGVVERAQSDPEGLRKDWPRTTIAPFFRSNLTTKQFKRLNSELRYNRSEECLAEVVGNERGVQCTLRALQDFTLPVRVLVMDPNGAEISAEIAEVRDLNGETSRSVHTDQVVVGPWIKRASVGALVMRGSAMEQKKGSERAEGCGE